MKKVYADHGIAGIKPKTRGHRTGEKRTLIPGQEQKIQIIIVDKTPEQMRFKECMWTRNNIRSLILQKYKIDMLLSPLGYYLVRCFFSVQSPIKRAYKKDGKQIKTG